MTAKQAARALGWFSIGLGVAEVVAAKWFGKQIGVKAFGAISDRVVYLSHGETHEFEVNPNRWQKSEVTTVPQPEKVNYA